MSKPIAGQAPACHRAESYRGKNLAPDAEQLKRAVSGDLRGFWKARLGLDPVARIGVAMWGTQEDLERAIGADAPTWTPCLSKRARRALTKTLAEAGLALAVPPRSQADLVSYWRFMGKSARERLEGFLQREQGYAPASAEMEARTRWIGRELAAAHLKALGEDYLGNEGKVRGLLSKQQISAYHQDVFNANGLPDRTFGGTPYAFLPDWLERFVAGDLWAHDADQ